MVIAPQNPYPPVDGGKISIYYPLIHLSKFFQIHFVFIYSDDLPTDIKKHFLSHSIHIYPQYLQTRDTIQNILLSVFSPLPYKFRKYCKTSILKNVKKIITNENISKIWCNHSHVAWYGLQLKNLNNKIYLREHNIEYFLVEQMLTITRGFFIKSLIRYQFIKTKKFELKCWIEFEATFFISDSDIKKAKNAGAIKNPILLYDSFEEKLNFSVQQKEPFSFIFTGSLSSVQNFYNLKTFISNIWQPLVNQDKRWRLYVTGNNEAIFEKKLGKLEKYNVINMGYVDNIQSVIASKKYFVSPAYIGSGVRIKVLNALSAGCVCFMTPLDVRMLAIFKDLQNVVEFCDANSFSEKLNMLENNPMLYNSISLQAKEVESFFSWDAYAEKVRDEFKRN